MKIGASLGKIIGTFIGTIFGLALTPEVIKYSHNIEADANASDLVKLFAPYISLFWVLGILGLAGAIMYSELK